MNDATKTRLLEHYATHEPKRFTQLDGFADQERDGFPGEDYVDDDGDGLFGPSMTLELMHGATVRALVDPNAPRETILRLLDKLRASVEQLHAGETFAQRDERNRARELRELDEGAAVVDLDAVRARRAGRAETFPRGAR